MRNCCSCMNHYCFYLWYMCNFVLLSYRIKIFFIMVFQGLCKYHGWLGNYFHEVKNKTLVSTSFSGTGSKLPVSCLMVFLPRMNTVKLWGKFSGWQVSQISFRDNMVTMGTCKPGLLLLLHSTLITSSQGLIFQYIDPCHTVKLTQTRTLCNFRTVCDCFYELNNLFVCS